MTRTRDHFVSKNITLITASFPVALEARFCVAMIKIQIVTTNTDVSGLSIASDCFHRCLAFQP